MLQIVGGIAYYYSGSDKIVSHLDSAPLGMNTNPSVPVFIMTPDKQLLHRVAVILLFFEQ